jgi:transcriptional regulator with XRE-family HTH domain
MPGFRARRAVILHRAIDLDLPLTPTGLADALGMHHKTIARALRGETLSATTMANLAAKLEVSMDDLFEAVDGDQPARRRKRGKGR